MIYALWTYKRAHAGQETELEVKTSMVGNGAKIKITCKNESGKKLGKSEGVVFNNKFSGAVLTPDNVKPDDMVFFEAELPKHGLKGESNSIPARPAIVATKLQWDRKEVKREDIVTLTCQFKSGVEDGDEAIVSIYEHNPNSCDIKVVSIPTTIKGDKIEMQWKFDYQDDAVFIPTDGEMQPYKKNYANPQFYFMVVVDGVKIGEKRESGLMKFKDSVKLTIVDDCGSLLKEQTCVLQLPDGAQRKGVSDGNGIIEYDALPPGRIALTCDDVAKESIVNPDPFENAVVVVAGSDDETETVVSGGKNIVMVIPPQQGKIEFALKTEDLSSVYADREVAVEGAGISKKGKTDENGIFSLKPVDYGDYSILVGDGKFTIPAIPDDAQPYPVVVPSSVLPDQRDLWKQPTDDELEPESTEGE